MSNGPCRRAATHAIGARCDEVVLPYLDAAYRLARWLTRKTCSGRRGDSVHAPTDPLGEERHSSARPGCDPETLLLQTVGAAQE